MYNNEFWSVVLAIAVFFLGMVGGIILDYITAQRAAQKEQIKENEAEIRRLKAKISFYKSLLEERNERPNM